MRISDWSSDVCSSDLLVKNLIDNVAAILEPIIDDGGISRLGDAAPGPDDQQRWRFRLLHRVRHFDDGFDAMIVNPDGLTACEAVNALVEIEIGEIFAPRSEEHTSELQTLMRISYSVC